MSFGLFVHFKLKSGSEEDFDNLVAKTLSLIQENEPDTFVYATHSVQTDPRERVFYELYRDHAAFMRHEEQPYVQRFLSERKQFVERVAVTFLSLLDAKGISSGNEEL